MNFRGLGQAEMYGIDQGHLDGTFWIKSVAYYDVLMFVSHVFSLAQPSQLMLFVFLPSGEANPSLH